MAGEDLSGRWIGSVRIPDLTLPLVVDLARDNAGDWVGSAILPGRGVKGAEIREIRVQGETVTFAIPRALGGITLQGRVAGDSLAGEMTQAGHRAPFELHREGKPQIDPPRRSTAIRKDMEGEWKGQYELMGAPRQVTLRLSQENGVGKANLVIVGRRVNQVPVDRVILDGELLLLESDSMRILMEMRLQNGGSLGGMFTQGPYEAAVTLNK